jgi:hypothetical protein
MDGHAGTVTSTTVFNLPVNGLLVDPVRDILYATVPASAGVGVGNSITRIDLAAKTILDSTFIGSQPTAMAISSDGSQMYVSLSGSYQIREFNPATLTAGPQVPVANNYMIGSLAVVPTHPDTFVGSVLRSGSPIYVGIGVWHFDGTNFTTNGPVGIGAVNLVYSNNPSTFYATSGATLAQVTLGPGDSLSAQYGPPLGQSDPGIAFGGNLVVSTQARATNTTTFTAAGIFSGGENSGGVAVDAAANKVYLLRGQTIRIFDMTTMLQIDSLTVPQVGTAGAYSLFRYGSHGLAFDTDQGKVMLVESNSIGVPEPSSVMLAGLGFAGLVSGIGAEGALSRSMRPWAAENLRDVLRRVRPQRSPPPSTQEQRTGPHRQQRPGRGFGDDGDGYCPSEMIDQKSNWSAHGLSKSEDLSFPRQFWRHRAVALGKYD